MPGRGRPCSALAMAARRAVRIDEAVKVSAITLLLIVLPCRAFGAGSLEAAAVIIARRAVYVPFTLRAAPARRQFLYFRITLRGRHERLIDTVHPAESSQLLPSVHVLSAHVGLSEKSPSHGAHMSLLAVVVNTLR